jgi:hypothetical protein
MMAVDPDPELLVKPNSELDPMENTVPTHTHNMIQSS